MRSWINSAAARPLNMETSVSAKSMPAVMPPPVMRLRSMHTLSRDTSAPKKGKASVAVQCVAARYPSSRPAAPSTSEPVQTDVTYCALPACRRRNASTSSSSMSSSVP